MFEDELPSLRSTLAAVCNNVAPFSLPIAGIGFFNNSVWAKVSSEAGLTGLATDINRACATLGYPVATKPFFPHLTLARLGRNSTLARTELSEKYGTNVWTTIAANSLNLYESITYADGASYNVIGCYPFSAET